MALRIAIPGQETLQLSQLVLDYNGTLACDGTLIEGVQQKLATLAENMTVHVITADTFGTVQASLADISCELVILPANTPQDLEKRNFVQKLGEENTVAIGNGRNDRLMLETSALGIAVIEQEGVAVNTLLAADVVAPGILAALDLLCQPLRLTATLRV
jgi:soluble P-type ATPase